MAEDYYYKEIDVGGDSIDLAYWIFLVLMGAILVFMPSYGFFVGLILMAFAVVKLIAFSKDYTNILFLFLIGMFAMILSGLTFGEWVVGGILILIGIIGLIKAR